MVLSRPDMTPTMICSLYAVSAAVAIEVLLPKLLSSMPQERPQQLEAADAEGRLLVVVDDSEASQNAVKYVCDTLSDLPGLHVCLAHSLPPFPPELTELVEREGDQKAWTLAAKQEAMAHGMESAAKTLLAAGIPANRIDTSFFQAETNGEGSAEAILDLARANNCQAIVVGRDVRSWFENPFSYNLVKKLLRAGKGFNIWVVPLQAVVQSRPLVPRLAHSGGRI